MYLILSRYADVRILRSTKGQTIVPGPQMRPERHEYNPALPVLRKRTRAFQEGKERRNTQIKSHLMRQQLYTGTIHTARTGACTNLLHWLCVCKVCCCSWGRSLWVCVQSRSPAGAQQVRWGAHQGAACQPIFSYLVTGFCPLPPFCLQIIRMS